MRKGKEAERIVINLNIFTSSAKPDIVGELKLSPGSPGEPVIVDLLLSFPEDDVPEKIEIDCSGPVKSIEKYFVIPESKEFNHRLIVKPTFSDTSKHELLVIMKHGIYYTSILPDILQTFSCTPPEITIKGVEAANYRVIPGELVELNIVLDAQEKESPVEIWGDIFEPGGKKLHHLDKRNVIFSGEHRETYTVSISGAEKMGEIGVEVFVRQYDLKTSKGFKNVFFLAGRYDISLSMLNIEPRSILRGSELTVTAGITNLGVETLDLSAGLRFRKNGEDIFSVPLGKITLEANSSGGIVQEEYRFLVEDTRKLPPGTYELLLEITGDVEATETDTIDVTGGKEIEFFGATTDKYSYSPGEYVHLTALYRTGGQLIDEKFTSRITAETINGKVLCTSDEVLDVNRVEPNEVGELELVIHLDEKKASGYVNVNFEIYVDTDNTPLSVFRLPYMFSIEGARQFSVKVEKEKAPVDIGGRLSVELKREIGTFLFHGEKVAEAVRDKNFTTLRLDNDTCLILYRGKVLCAPDEMNNINSAVLARTAANMGFGGNYFKELAKNIDCVKFLVECIICSYREDFPFMQSLGKDEPALETPGDYTSNMMKGYGKGLRKRIEGMPRGRKRQVLAKKVLSDTYLMENLIRRISKNSGTDKRDLSILFDHFTPLGDVTNKRNRSVKNTEMAKERIIQLDPDYASFFHQNVDYLAAQLDSGTLKDIILKKMEKGNPEYVTDNEKIYPMGLGFMSVYFLNRVSGEIEGFYTGEKMKPEGLAAYVHNFNMACYHLHLFFSILGLAMPSHENKCKKACNWLRDCLRSNTRNHIRILDETLIFLADFKKNMKIRKTVAEFRNNVQMRAEYDRVEGAEGTILEIPITARCNAKKDVMADFTVLLPGKDYKVHWPPAKTLGNNNSIEAFRLEPGTKKIPFRIELPSVLPAQMPEILILAHPRRGNLVGRKNTPAFGLPDGNLKDRKIKDTREKDRISSEIEGKQELSKDIPKSLEDGVIIKRITDALSRPGRYADLGKDQMGKVEKEVLLENMAKEIGMHKRKLRDILKESRLFKLSEVTVKGGFLKMRTVVSYNIRFATSREIHETLMDRSMGLLAEAGKHPITAARVLSVYMKILREMPGVKESGAEKHVYIPARPQASDTLLDAHDRTSEPLETQYEAPEISTIPGKDLNRQFMEKIRENTISGKRSINSFKSLVSMLMEMEPKDVRISIMNNELNFFDCDTLPGKIMSSACICAQTRLLLSDPRDHDIKEFLLQHIARSPLKECVFEQITKPNLDHLLYQSREEANVTLARLKYIANSYTAPALASVLFTVPKETRPLVLKVLGELKDERVVPSLVKMLKSSVEMEDRQAALKALISMGAPEARDHVEAAIVDDPEMARIAEESGFRATGEESHEDEHIILD